MDRDENTIVCRCEDVTLADIKRAVSGGCRTIDEVKRVTRAGMGPCRGNSCRRIIAGELSSRYDIPMEEILMPTFRPVLKPVKLGLFVKEAQGE